MMYVISCKIDSITDIYFKAAGSQILILQYGDVTWICKVFSRLLVAHMSRIRGFENAVFKNILF